MNVKKKPIDAGKRMIETCADAVFSLDGEIGRRLEAVTRQWILPAPYANPGMLEMFRQRDRQPSHDLVPWAGEFAGKYLTHSVQVWRLTRDAQLGEHIRWFVGELTALQADDGYLGPWPKAYRLRKGAPNCQRFNLPQVEPWDAWGHYHAMIGLLLGHQDTADPKALACVRRIGDLFCDRFLDNPKERLHDTGEHEMNQAPVHALAWLYRLTGERRYLRMAEQIVAEFAIPPAGQMTMGYNPYFLYDSLDYFCEHNYPMPQCLPGGMGNPLDSDDALQRWLVANEIMGRLYTSLGKPVVLEEWGWYGPGRAEFAGVDMGERTAEDQLRYCEAMMETTQHVFQGWLYWMHRDMPYDADLTSCSGLFTAAGELKPWGKRYAEWAARLQGQPPILAPAKDMVDIDMKKMFTDDRYHETWWHDMVRDYPGRGPLDFRYVFERKPMTDWPNDIRSLDIISQQKDAWAQ
jgi:hypothetical protein